MYRDSYFPDFLVDKIRGVLIDLCEKIEAQLPETPEALFLLTHSATESINDLGEEFEENGSELETEAREVMAENFDFIVKAYGFPDVDIEDVIAPREW
ncbi:hypothetical protein B3C1_00035 [Gallaecimonas xiamenensis 3-C-1]|uniref:Uncharacterized protein n=2 Tax=Gallaecimonas TaxID=745410 RepID=K2J456_9GAMM|nr:hypothetical protein B3C1_00035 [Gallaecimonas xiamenensis 3-C-1]